MSLAASEICTSPIGRGSELQVVQEGVQKGGWGAGGQCLMQQNPRSHGNVVTSVATEIGESLVLMLTCIFLIVRVREHWNRLPEKWWSHHSQRDFTDMASWFSGVSGSAGLMFGPDDLKGLSQTK